MWISDLIARILGKPVNVVLLIVTVFGVETATHSDFYQLGVYPRTLAGVLGIMTSPLVHGGYGHISANLPTLLLLLVILYGFFPRRAEDVFFYSYLGTGLMTWLIGRPAYHIGASGILYALAFFLMSYGPFCRRRVALLVALPLIAAYHGLINGMLPDVPPYISWEGHLSGAIVGVLCAAYYGLRDRAADLREREPKRRPRHRNF